MGSSKMPSKAADLGHPRTIYFAAIFDADGIPDVSSHRMFADVRPKGWKSSRL